MLISIKAKNKVVTRNVNITCGSDGKTHRIVQLTPRGQLHNETVYGHRRQCIVKEEKVGSAFNKEKINTVSNPQFREALLRRYTEFGDAKKHSPARTVLIKILYTSMTTTQNKFPKRLRLLHSKKSSLFASR